MKKILLLGVVVTGAYALTDPYQQNRHFVGVHLGSHMGPGLHYLYQGQSQAFGLAFGHLYSSRESAWSTIEGDSEAPVVHSSNTSSWKSYAGIFLNQMHSSMDAFDLHWLSYGYESFSLASDVVQRPEFSLGYGARMAGDKWTFSAQLGYALGVKFQRDQWGHWQRTERYLTPSMDLLLSYGFKIGPSHLGAGHE